MRRWWGGGGAYRYATNTLKEKKHSFSSKDPFCIKQQTVLISGRIVLLVPATLDLRIPLVSPLARLRREAINEVLGGLLPRHLQHRGRRDATGGAAATADVSSSTV